MDPVHGYAKSGDAHIAYSVMGDGPIDVLYVSTFTMSIDSLDEEPHAAHFFRRLASFARLIRFDVRGVGLSDPINPANPPSAAGEARDMEAVLDACNVERAAIVSENAIPAVEFVATRPERVSALVIMNGYARVVVDDDYPHGYERAALENFLDLNTDPDEQWSSGSGDDDLSIVAPSMRDDAQFRSWWTRASRRGASPASARAIVGMTTFGDVRARLPEVTTPTLVLHRADNLMIPADCGRYLGEHIEGARYVELPGADHAPFTGGADEIVDEIEEFLTGGRTAGGERVLASVLFTDIVDSTGRAAALGDTAWRSFLDTHDRVVRSELRRYRGREVNTTGDGFVAAFDSPTQAVRCAGAIVAASAAQDIAVRAGVHTGECEKRGDDLAGLTVHIAARVAALAASGEVLVSRTVRDLVAGSGLQFADRGEHVLKGVPESWQLFALDA